MPSRPSNPVIPACGLCTSPASRSTAANIVHSISSRVRNSSNNSWHTTGEPPRINSGWPRLINRTLRAPLMCLAPHARGCPGQQGWDRSKQIGNDHAIPLPVQQPVIEDRTAFRRLGPQWRQPIEMPHLQGVNPGGYAALQASQAQIDVFMDGAGILPGAAAKFLEPGTID